MPNLTHFFCTLAALWLSTGFAFAVERVDLSLLSPHWRTLHLPGTPRNQFQTDGSILEVHSDASASFRYIELDAQNFVTSEISWTWRVDSHAPFVSQTLKGFDDRPLAVHIWFDDTKDGQLFGAFGSVLGYPRIGHLLTYVWGAAEPAGSVLPNPHFERGTIFVVVGADGKAGEWSTVRRNIAQDYERAFGRKPDLSTLRYVAVSADSDDQNGRSQGAIRSLSLHIR